MFEGKALSVCHERGKNVYLGSRTTNSNKCETIGGKVFINLALSMALGVAFAVLPGSGAIIIDGKIGDLEWKLDANITINNAKDTDAGWSVESRLLWEDMDVDGREVKGKTMGWNILVAEQPGAKPISWSEEVIGWNNNHNCSAWGEITFGRGYVSIEPRGKLPALWGTIKHEN